MLPNFSYVRAGSPEEARRHLSGSAAHLLAGGTDLLGCLRAEDVGRVAPAEPRTEVGRLGLADRAEHFPHQLSGGEQQRLAFARGARIQ